MFATALVTSRLDYCNSVFHNIAIIDITKPRVQNCLARVVTRSPRFTHSKPLLKSAVASCPISYHLFCKQPSYLHSLLTPVRKPVQL